MCARPLRHACGVGTLGQVRAILVSLLGLLLLATTPAAASNLERYADDRGDATLAPDIGAVEVANDDRGTLRWAVEVHNRDALLRRDLYVFWLDVDLNARNGARGADFAVVVDGGKRTATLARSSGGRWVRAGQHGLRVRWAGGLQIELPRELVDSPRQLDFSITAASDGDVDRTPVWRFGLIVSP